MAELGAQALAGADLGELMNDTASMLAQTLGVEFAEVLELLPGEQEFLLRAEHGWREDQRRTLASLGWCGHGLRLSACDEEAGDHG